MPAFNVRAALTAETTSPASVMPVANSVTKRALDLMVALAALLLFLPLLLLIAAAIKMDSRGAVLFRQRRTGLNGKPFRIYKFRTMWVAEDGADVQQASRVDARVTSVGRVLRRLSLDELPQLLNIVRGEMSFVGPRPHALAHDEVWSLTVSGYKERFRARPGLTGYAQTRGLRGEVRGLDAICDRVAADNEYIEQWTFAGDLKLIAKTIPLLFHDAAAY
jgi:putative colanic acid biosynthesis UDP-glucose lipid carrier transferase